MSREMRFVLLAVLVGLPVAFWLAGALPGQGSIPLTPKVTAIGQTIRAVGYVEPESELRRLTFKVEGVVGEHQFAVGDHVRAGDQLAVLQNADEKAAVAVAEQALAVKKAQRDLVLSGVHPKQIEAAERRVGMLQENQRFVHRTLDRESSLYKRQASSQEAFDSASTERRAIDEELASALADEAYLKTQVRAEDRVLAEAEVQLAEAHLGAARERLNNTVLVAPISGVIVEILKREGEVAHSIDNQPVLMLADLSKLRVRAEIDERFVSVLQVGQSAVLYGRGIGDRRVKAEIVFVKRLMGKKTVFTSEATERKDLEVLELLVEPREEFQAPLGLRIDVDIDVAAAAPRS